MAMVELEEYLARLENGGEAERIYAAEDIGYANSARGIAPLLARLPVEPSRAVREAIFAALQGIEGDEVTVAALGLLASEDAFVRNQAIELLRKRGAEVIPFLRHVFLGTDKDQRKMVLDVLAGVDGPGSSEIYDLALSDPDLNVVITAVESLGNAGKTEFRERIEQFAAADRHLMLAGACIEALAHIGNHQSLAAIRARASAASAAGNFLLPSFLKMLGAHGSESAISEAAELLNTRPAHLHESILNAITILRQRYPSAILPESLGEPLEKIALTSPPLRYQALRILCGLARVPGVSTFLAGCPDLERESEQPPRDFRA